MGQRSGFRWWRVVFATCLSGALAFLLYRRVEWHALGAQVASHWTQASWWQLLLAVALLPFNWLAENRKWMPMLRQLHPAVSEWQALRAVLAGAAVSLLTPNRIGEYGGRLLLIDAPQPHKVFLINLVCNISQILALLTCGFAGAWLLAGRLGPEGHNWSVWLPAAGIPALLGGWLLYFNIDWFLRLIGRVRLLIPAQRFVKSLGDLGAFSRPDLAHALWWAFVRCGIYSTQYYLLVCFFGIQVGMIDGFACIFVLFAIQTGIPLPLLSGWLLRGNLAVEAWSYWQADPLASVAATFALWIINLILPALFGTFFILNVRKTNNPVI